MKKLITAITFVFSAGVAMAGVTVTDVHNHKYNCTINIYDLAKSGALEYWPE